MDYSQDAIRELIRQANLERVGGELERLMKPSIRLRMRMSGEASIPVGASKFGGLPDLPPGVEWPHCAELPPEEASRFIPLQGLSGPLWFLTQVRLADAAPFDVEGVLPPSGLLYFFAALHRDGFPNNGVTPDCWRVLYYDGDLSVLRRTPVPPMSEALRHAIGYNSQLPEGHVLPSYAVEFSLSYTLPSNPEVDMTDEEGDRYNETFWDVFHGDDGAHRHQLLGYEGEVQGSSGEMAAVCEKAVPHELFAKQMMTSEAWQRWEQYKRERAEWEKHWRLLLQLDTQPEISLFFPAWGRGYFWVTDEALASRRFDQTCFVNQHT